MRILPVLVAAGLALAHGSAYSGSADQVPMPAPRGPGGIDAAVNGAAPTPLTRFLADLGRRDKTWSRAELAGALLERCRNAESSASRSEIATLIDMLAEDGLINSDGSLDAQLQLREVALTCIELMPGAQPYTYLRSEGVTPAREILSVRVSGNLVRFHVTALDAKDVGAAQAGTRAWESRMVAKGVSSAPSENGGTSAVAPVVDQELRACAPRPGQTCFTVRGRLWITNGGPWRRIWIVGTQRILGVHDDYELPKNVDERLGVDEDHPFGTHLFGNYTFCPSLR